MLPATLQGRPQKVSRTLQRKLSCFKERMHDTLR